jgi:hypothetical protein
MLSKFSCFLLGSFDYSKEARRYLHTSGGFLYLF